MIINVPLDRITANPWQTRIGEPDSEYIRELALDIADHGLLQTPVGRVFGFGAPIVIDRNIDQEYLNRKFEDPTYSVQLAFGHNRLAAFRYLNDLREHSDIKGDYSVLPVDIRNYADEQMAEVAWAENEQRRDVTPIERAHAIEKRIADFGWSQQEVADHLGLARPTVSNIRRLLKLPEDIQAAVGRGDISARVASALLPMYDLPAETLQIANVVSWSSHQPRGIVETALAGASSDKIRQLVDDLYRQYTRRLQEAEFGLNEIFPENLKVEPGKKVWSGVCRTCDRRLKETGNICLDIGCYDAKTELHRRAYLASAAASSGYEVSDPDKGGSVSLLYSEMSEQIKATKCPNLRLIYTDEKPRNEAAQVPGFPHAQIICDKRNDSCTCQKGLRLQGDLNHKGHEEHEVITKSEQVFEALPGVERVSEPVRAQTGPSAQELEELARKGRQAKAAVPAKYKELKAELMEMAVEWLKADEPGALYAVIFNNTYMTDLDTLERIYRQAAEQVAKVVLLESASTYKSVEEMYERANWRLAALHLPQVSQGKMLIEVLQENKS